MCVLVVPEELKQLQQLQQEQAAKEASRKRLAAYRQNFDNYWQVQDKDNLNLVASEQSSDSAFLEMVRYQHMP